MCHGFGHLIQIKPRRDFTHWQTPLDANDIHLIQIIFEETGAPV